MPHNAIINWLAASSFAAYLFHGVVIYDYFKPLMLRLYSEYKGVFCLVAMGSALLAFYIIAVLLDQPRKWLWKLIAKKIFLAKRSH